MRRDDVNPERLFAVLRLVAVPIMLASVLVVPGPEETPAAFRIAITAFLVYAVAAAVLLGPAPSERLQTTLSALDVAFGGILNFTSGGGFSQLRFAFVFVPMATAFRRRPGVTLVASVAAVAVYVAQALAHPSRSARGDAISFLLVQAAYLAWIGAAATLLAYILAHREATLGRLLGARQRLVAEAIAAEERERQRLAEVLHDEAIQHLLAARYDLEGSTTSGLPEAARARAYAAVTETIGRLRSTMADLHPYLLDQIGVEGALNAAARRAAERGGFVVELDLELRPGGGNDRVLLRCASELLANAASHARARAVRVVLRSADQVDTLVVTDDGVGFDPAVLDGRMRDGHIGVLSLRERAEGLGGAFALDTGPGAGTRVELTLPRTPGSS